MNEIFEKIYNNNNTNLNEDMALFEKVYMEVKMLNEMNPKLKALLAAGLIGTAGLGAVSCSMPTDDPTGYEQPAPETTNPDDPGDNGGGEENPTDGGEETVTEETVTFESLGVTPEHAARLAGATKQIKASSEEVKVYNAVPISKGKTVYIYRNGHFELASSEDEDAYDDNSERGDIIYIRYNESNNRYYVPLSMESDFDAAIAAYKATYAE